MAKKTTNPPRAVDQQKSIQPDYQFKPFKWTPDLPHGAQVPALYLSSLVEHVKDVVNGAALVFELMEDHDSDIDSDRTPYLNSYHLGVLQRMAQRSLHELANSTDEMARDLHALERVSHEPVHC